MISHTMKALVLRGIGNLNYDIVPIPKQKKDEVLLKIRASGICGSDISRVFNKGTYHFPTIIGHEFAGEIIEAKNKSLIGKKASVFPLLPCKKCEACKTLNYAQCQNYDYYGSRRDGGMAEYITVNENNLSFISDAVSFEEAAMSEPAAVAIHAFNKCEIKPNDTILIYGVGAIGLIFAQLTKSAGVKNIILAARTKEKTDFAKKLGFPYAINVKTSNLKNFVNELTNGKGAKICIEGTGNSAALQDCIENADNFAKIVCLGNPLKEMTLSQNTYWKILRKELSLIGTWNSCFSEIKNDWEEAKTTLKIGKIDLKSLITHKFSLSDYKKAFDIMKNKTEMYCKIMFIFD